MVKKIAPPVTEINKEIREKKEIVNISEDIKEKCRELRRIKEGIQQVAGEYLQAVVQPLKTLASIESEKQRKKATPVIKVASTTTTTTKGSALTLDELNLLPLNNKFYGLKYNEKEKQFYIGNIPVTVTENSIIVGDKTYLRTPDLVSLLTTRHFKQRWKYGKSDLQAYHQIIEDTETHKRSKKDPKPTKGPLYLFIKKLLSSTLSDIEDDDGDDDGTKGEDDVSFNSGHLVFSTPISKKGSGISSKCRKVRGKKASKISNECKRNLINTQIRKRLMTPTKAEYEYMYYDNPNELVERLKLLYGEQLAGNVNNTQISNKIQHILEELEE